MSAALYLVSYGLTVGLAAVAFARITRTIRRRR